MRHNISRLYRYIMTRRMDMDKIKRKIISGAVLAGCALIGLGGISLLSHRNAGEAIPTSLVTNESEKPVIVLDAGHGESF